MNKFFLFILKMSLIGFLIQLFSFHIAPLLMHYVFIYLKMDFVFFIDFNNFYTVLIILSWFFYFLFSIFEILVDFLLYHKYGRNVLYLILFIFFYFYLVSLL